MDSEDWIGCIVKAILVLLFILGVADCVNRCNNSENTSIQNDMDDDGCYYRERWDGRNGKN